MKKFVNKNTLLLLSLALLANASCTKDFVKDNVDKNALTAITPAEFPYLFNRALSSATTNATYYETTQNYFADIYAQYFAKSVSTERYNINTIYTGRMFLASYVQVGSQLKTILNTADPQSAEVALANIMWVYNFARLTDVVGPIPYFDALKEDGNTSVKYDAMKDIYADFFLRLNTSISLLKAKDPTTIVFNGKDNLYSGSLNRWVKFANTLKLRLALRISKVDPATAKKWAEEAVQSGVIDANTDNAAIVRSAINMDSNGLAHISTWSGSSMSSTMKSYLAGYEDPRLGIYFQKNFANGKYASRRNGMPASDINTMVGNVSVNANTQQAIAGPYWVTYSTSGSLTANTAARQHILSAAESYFLRAEAALNGWNVGGTAQDFYETGIRKSLEQWGQTNSNTVDAYINSTNLPQAPQDFYNSPAVSTTPIKWANAIALQRKQIGTQKWLAIYPDGWEAWAEFRRTGYPDMYPIINSENPDVPVGTFIKRLTYPQTEYTSNLEGLNVGIKLLGGKDNAATKLWWDID